MRPLIAVALAFAPLMAAAGCLTYEQEVTLTGVVHLKTAPGAPNHESIAPGDRAERVLTLDLNAPVCIEGQGRDRIYVRREGATSVQLVLPSESSIKFGENRRATVVGTLSGRVTGNPRTPVLLRVRALKNAP